MIYQLMHKDKVCGELTEMSGIIQSECFIGRSDGKILGSHRQHSDTG